MNRKYIDNLLEYLLLLLTILLSGSGITFGLFTAWPYVMFPLLSMLFYSRGGKVYSNEAYFLFLLFLVLFVQMFLWRGAVTSIVQPFLFLLCIYLFSKIIDRSFTRKYLNIITFLCYASLTCWLILLLPAGKSTLLSIADQLPQLGYDNLREVRGIGDFGRTLYFYTIPLGYFEESIKNMGPFWESGRFTIFITLALLINLSITGFKFSNRRTLLFIITNITTFSTTGYIAMLMVLAYVLYRKSSSGMRIFTIPFAALTIFLIFNQTSFMAEKILHQAGDLGNNHSRFGAAVYQLKHISQSPLVGYGVHLKSQFTNLLVSPNGWTSLLRWWGIPVSALLCWMMYKGTKVYLPVAPTSQRYLAFGVMLVLCFSQTCMTDPFFYLLYFFAFSKKLIPIT